MGYFSSHFQRFQPRVIWLCRFWTWEGQHDGKHLVKEVAYAASGRAKKRDQNFNISFKEMPPCQDLTSFQQASGSKGSAPSQQCNILALKTSTLGLSGTIKIQSLTPASQRNHTQTLIAPQLCSSTYLYVVPAAS